MYCKYWAGPKLMPLLVIIALLGIIVGCGNSTTTQPAAQQDEEAMDAGDDTAEDDAAGDDTADDDTAEDDTAEDDTAEDDTADDDTADDDTADDDTADDDTAEDDTAEDDTAEDDTAEDDTAEDDTVGSTEGQTWLVMMYADADDQTLEHDIFIDLNEAERVGSSDQVQIVAQIDRFKGAFKGDGDWTSAKRFYIDQDDDLSTINSEELEDLGEVNMGDDDTLIDFATWAIETYPADKYVLLFSDHGMGWPGGWSDPDPAGPGEDGTTMLEDEDMLLLSEISNALDVIVDQSGIEGFELIGFDACLMSHIEVYSAIAPYANFAVASQETEPALGWSYTAFLSSLVENPAMDGGELATAIVETYIDQDTRLVDDESRADFMDNLGIPQDTAKEDLLEYFKQDITLSAINLAAIPDVLAALDKMIDAMGNIDQSIVATARTYAQAYDHFLGQDFPSSYIDLGHFAAIIYAESDTPEIQTAIEELDRTFSEAILAEKHGPERPGATGISIYFPTSEVYTELPIGSYENYVATSDYFVEDSQWDNFLAYHYTGEEIASGIPEAGTRFVAPGESQITVSPLTLSSEEVASDDTLTISTEVTGKNIGYIYFYLGYYDEESNSVLVADEDFIDAGETKEVSGITYPHWGDEASLPLDYEWEPTLYEITDGTNTAFALLQPEEYGKTTEDTTYVVEGVYTFVDSGEERYADLIFNGEGQLQKVIGYAGEDGTGAPHQITPENGDTFMVLEQWYDLPEDDAEEFEVEFYEVEGDTLTFGDTPFVWEAVIAPAGEYEVGIIAEDLDGNYYEEYADVTVTE